MKFERETMKISIEKVNNAVREDSNGLIERSEKYYKGCVQFACDSIVEKTKNIILLTGPSSAGKTTTSILLSNELASRNKKAIRISLDNFYKDRDDLPFWEDGSRNYESIQGIDLECFGDCVYELMANGIAEFPIFDFTVGMRSDRTFTVEYDNDTFIIFEGIHALSPELRKMLQGSKSTRLYVSLHSDFVDNNGQKVLSARNLRLIRRLIRDNSERATDPVFTLDLWGKVCLGEEKYIWPYRDNADLHINSAHKYEPMVYKKAITELLTELKNHPQHKDIINDLLEGISHFDELETSVIPSTSLLREFIN